MDVQSLLLFPQGCMDGSWGYITTRNIFVTMAMFVSMTSAKTLVSDTLSDKMKYDVGEEPWLTDGSFYDMDSAYQADGYPIETDLCPRVPKELPPGGCTLKECRSDRECLPLGLMCCYNGCVYTCLQQVRPDAPIDRLREPKQRAPCGNSWLIQGSEPDQDFISCSTTPPDDDSDPLMCPHGYECVIDSPAVPSEGIPNNGHCEELQDIRDEEEDDDEEEEGEDDEDSFETNLNESVTDIPEMESQHDCQIDGDLRLLSGHSAVVNGKKCLCIENELQCD